MHGYRRLLEKWSLPILFGYAALVVSAAFALRGFRISMGTTDLLDPSDPDLTYYNLSRLDWESDEFVLLSLTRSEWFSPEAVALLREFDGELRKLPHVRRTLSILNVPLFRSGHPVPLFLGDARCDLQKAREELRDHTQVRGNLLSGTAREVSVLVFVRDPPELKELYLRRLERRGRRLSGGEQRLAEEDESRYRKALEEARRRRAALFNACRRLGREWSPRFDEPVRLSGITAINVGLVEYVERDLATFGILCACGFAAALVLIYRRSRWLLLPWISCSLPPVLVLGLMSAMDEPVTAITSNLPVLLFVLTLPYSIYLIESYCERRALRPAEDAVVATFEGVRRIWRPCLYSATTTMAGFLSLLTSGIGPVRTFGWAGALGMFLALGAIFLFMASALRRLAPLPPPRIGIRTDPPPVLRPLVAAASRAPILVALAGFALLVVSGLGTLHLSAENKFISYFHPSSEIYQGLEFVDTRLGGTTPLEVILRAAPGFFRTAEGFRVLDDVASFFRGLPETGSVRSLQTLMEEMRKTFRGTDEGTLRLVELVEAGRERIREFALPDYSAARVVVRFKETAPTLHRKNILERLEAHLARPELASLQERRVTGVFLVYSNLLQTLLRSQRDTLVLVIVAIYVMLVVLFRDLRLAALVLVPQLLPVFAVLGAMGFLGIPLDAVTTMIASMAMGVGIDPAIQYAFRYRSELSATGNPAEAILRSHATIGRAIFLATSTTLAGFLILAFSNFVPTVYYGLFTGLAMLLALLSSLSLLPSLFVLFRYPRP